jgi:hypothetical protein
VATVKRNFARFGVALVSAVVLAIGVLSLVDFWPRWVWITLGVLGLVGIVVQFVWERHGADSGEPPVTNTVNQKQRGGKGSTNNQAGRDINFGNRGSGSEG